MCSPAAARSVNLNRSLMTVEEALTDFEAYDTHDRIKWTPAESLSGKPMSCAISTAAQLRAFLKPALHSPAANVTHSTRAPYRSVLEYAGEKNNPHFVVLTHDTIKDHGSHQVCAINYRLAYYLATALGSNHTPPFAINSFDVSMATYIKCLVQEPQSGYCKDIFDELPLHEKDRLEPRGALMDRCEDMMKEDQPPLRSQGAFIRYFRKRTKNFRDTMMRRVEHAAELTKERRNTLRAELQKVPLSQKKIKTPQGAHAAYADIRNSLSALFQTTAGRYYFWELRTPSFFCKDVTTPVQRATTPHIETAECSYSGVTIRKDFVVETKRAEEDVVQE